MGQKVNPIGLRTGVIKDWNSHWYAEKKDFGATLVNDYELRDYITNKLAGELSQARAGDEKAKELDLGIGKVVIDRTSSRIRITIHTSRPGALIGKGGQDVARIKQRCTEILGSDKDISINIEEIKLPDADAQLVAAKIADQLEKRVSFRRAVKQAIGSTMRLGAKGIKVQVSGRLGGAEIARSETYHEGTIPLQTIRADIDYGFTEAKTTYGRLGVKVWIYSGEVLRESRRNGGDRRRRGRGDRRDGDRPRSPRAAREGRENRGESRERRS